MNLYKITRTDGHDYDEYDALVVRAEDQEKALKMLSNCIGRDCGWHECDQYCGDYSGFRMDGSNAKVEEIPLDGEPGLIIGSFNAG